MYIAGLIIILIILVILAHHSYKKKHSVQNVKLVQMPHFHQPQQVMMVNPYLESSKDRLLDALCTENPAYCEDNMPMQGLNDMEQTPQTRGYVPMMNQPDHISNLWKSDDSQQNNNSPYKQEYKEKYLNEFMVVAPTNAPPEKETPIKASAVSMSVKDTSKSHITTRFASDSSHKLDPMYTTGY
jgi:hypothetical protein